MGGWFILPARASRLRAEARVQEGIESLAGYASVFDNNTLLSGTVPQVSTEPYRFCRRIFHVALLSPLSGDCLPITGI
jgi:hypothetical protein